MRTSDLAIFVFLSTAGCASDRTAPNEVGGAATNNVGGAATNNVGGAATNNVGGAATNNVGGAGTNNVSGAATNDVGGAATNEDPKDASTASPDAAGELLDAGDAGRPSSRQTQKPLGTTTSPNGYLEYLPPDYTPAHASPLLVFWHGVGQDGNGTSDLGNVAGYGPPELIAKDKWNNAWPFVVLSPQYPAHGGDIA